MLWNTLLLSLREVRRNLLRSFLTMLGIVIGVAAVVTMVTLGRGATKAVQAQIASLGTNLLQIRPGQRMGPPSAGTSGAPSFKEADVEAILTQIGGVAAAAPESRAAVTVVANGRNWSTTATGSSNTWLQVGNWTLAEGRPFTEAEQQAGSAVCLVGQTLKRELYAGQSPVGQPLRVKGFSCEVVGLLTGKGPGAMGNDQDDVVLLPLHTLQRRVSGNTRVGTLLVSMAEGSDTARLKQAIGELLRERRKLGAADDDNFNVLDTQQLAQTFSGTTQIMTTLLGAVAAVSLLVGGIGIMNIMLVSVTERTREIGIRLAIGALEREVLLQFLVEAVVLSALGGLLGLVIAFGACELLSGVMGLPFLFDPGINALAFGFSAGIGVVFGYFPARRAARLDPIEALRHE